MKYKSWLVNILSIVREAANNQSKLGLIIIIMLVIILILLYVFNQNNKN